MPKIVPDKVMVALDELCKQMTKLKIPAESFKVQKIAGFDRLFYYTSNCQISEMSQMLRELGEEGVAWDIAIKSLNEDDRETMVDLYGQVIEAIDKELKESLAEDCKCRVRR